MNHLAGYLIGIILAVTFGIGAFLSVRSVQAPTDVACTVEARMCPDGSSVGRGGLKCEFSPCPPSQKPPPPVDVPKLVSLRGEYLCLPHVNTSGPQTEECAFGLKTDDGMYYALSTQSLPIEAMVQLQTGKRISIEGILVPIEQISSDHWRIYPIKGIIEVKKIQ